jgi:hypothetical protein
MSMERFPSSVTFGSYLKYRPRSEQALAVLSQKVTIAIKQDKVMPPPYDTERAIPFLAARLRSRLDEYPFLKYYFGTQVVLVPAPRSSPLKGEALWPTLRICEALVAAGLAERVEPYLERVKPVRKSATAGPGERPEPADHYDSVALKRKGVLGVPTTITLVDDVITRGATFVGLLPHLQATFPNAAIRCFAFVRTVSSGEITQVLDPVEGTIIFDGGVLKRQP